MYLQHLAICKVCLPCAAVLLLPEGLGAAFVFDCCTCPLHGPAWAQHHSVPATGSRGCGVNAALSGGTMSDTRELTQEVLRANKPSSSNSSCESPDYSRVPLHAACFGIKPQGIHVGRVPFSSSTA